MACREGWKTILSNQEDNRKHVGNPGLVSLYFTLLRNAQLFVWRVKLKQQWYNFCIELLILSLGDSSLQYHSQQIILNGCLSWGKKEIPIQRIAMIDFYLSCWFCEFHVFLSFQNITINFQFIIHKDNFVTQSCLLLQV